MAFEHELQKKPNPFLPWPLSPLHPAPAESPAMSCQTPATPAISAPQPAMCPVDGSVATERAAAMSHWADAAVAQVAEKKAAAQKPVSGFDQVVNGQDGASISTADAPAEIALPRHLRRGMQRAWRHSMPHGRSQEQGGLYVRNPDGSTQWLPGASGESGSFAVNYDDVKPEQTILAMGHTHPYSKQEGGYRDVPFSGRDLALHVYEQQRMNVVQSGKGLFGSARTKEFDELVKARGEDGKDALFEEIEAYWDDLYTNGKGNLREKAEAATRATSEHYHLLYYAGKKGKLNKVDTAPPKPPANQHDAPPQAH